MILDSDLIRRRRIELRLSHRAVAAHLGVSGAVVRGIETGINHHDITLGLVAKLAEVLAVDITTLFHQPTTSNTGSADNDAAVLGAALYASDTLAPTTAVAAVLGWDAERTSAAVAELDGRLAGVGLRLRRLNGQLAIERSAEALDSERLSRVVRAHLLRAGLNLTEASLLHRILDGQQVRDLSNPDATALGTLTNAMLLDQGHALTADVLYSLCIND